MTKHQPVPAESAESKQNGWKITLNIEIDGQQAFSQPLGVDLLRSIVSNCPECEANAAFLSLMARHPSAGVRRDVAYKDCIDEKAVEALGRDSEIEVLRLLCNNQQFKRHGAQDLLLQLIAKDRDCAEAIATNLDEYENADAAALINALLSSDDPERRLFLANRYRLPVRIQKQLCADADPSVAAMAQKQMAER